VTGCSTLIYIYEMKSHRERLISVCIVLLLFSISSFLVFNVSAQQSGVAIGGNAQGGAAIGGPATCYSNCYYYYYGGPATGGFATSGNVTDTKDKGGKDIDRSSITGMVTKDYSFKKWGSSGSGGQFNGPEGIAVDSLGNVYVTDYVNDLVQKFDSNGAFITKWGSSGSGDGQFNGPEGIATDSSGNVYVTDFNNHRIQKFDSNGAFITKWGSWGLGEGKFNGPNYIAVDSLGNVYVTDYNNNRIQVFSPSS
jgi:tripartite motif-containing protein 71